MLLVDRFEVSEDEIVALKMWQLMIFLTDIFLSILLCLATPNMEAFTQTVGVWIGSKKKTKVSLVFMLVWIRVKFKRQVVPGDQPIMTAKFVKRQNNCCCKPGAEVDGSWQQVVL